MDRFPQLPFGGAPKLPESLWVLAEPAYDGIRMSTAPVLYEEPLSLEHDNAFPAFAVPPTSAVANDPNPVLSHPVSVRAANTQTPQVKQKLTVDFFSFVSVVSLRVGSFQILSSAHFMRGDAASVERGTRRRRRTRQAQQQEALEPGLFWCRLSGRSSRRRRRCGRTRQGSLREGCHELLGGAFEFWLHEHPRETAGPRQIVHHFPLRRHQPRTHR